VREKIAEKVSQHRDLPYPLVVFVAFNEISTRPSHEEIVSALYGSTRETFGAGGGIVLRAANWVWRHDRLQPLAVVSSPDVFAWTIEHRGLILWKNPLLESPALHHLWKYKVESYR